MEKIRIKALAASMESQSLEEEKDIPDFSNALSASLEDADVLKAIGAVFLVAAVATALVMVIQKSTSWLVGRISGNGSSDRRVSSITISSSYVVPAKKAVEESKNTGIQLVIKNKDIEERANERNLANIARSASSKIYNENKEYQIPWFLRVMSPQEIEKSNQACIRAAKLCSDFLLSHCGHYIQAVKNDSQNPEDYKFSLTTLSALSVQIKHAMKEIAPHFSDDIKDGLFGNYYYQFKHISAEMLRPSPMTYSNDTAVNSQTEKTINAIESLVKCGEELVIAVSDHVKNMDHYEAELKPLLKNKYESSSADVRLKHAITEGRSIIEGLIGFSTHLLGMPAQMTDKSRAVLERYVLVSKKATRAAEDAIK